MAYSRSLGYDTLASAIGYMAAIGLYLFARFWRQTIAHLSRVMVGISLLLLYYTTMRLGFFSSAPLIKDRYVALLLLLGVVAIQLAIALRRDWQALAAIATLLWVISALLIDRTHVTLALVAAGSAIATYLAVVRNWRPLLLAAIILAYAAHLEWLM